MSQTRERPLAKETLLLGEGGCNTTKWLGFTTMQDASRAPLQRVGARERRERCVWPARLCMAENGWYMPARALL